MSRKGNGRRANSSGRRRRAKTFLVIPLNKISHEDSVRFISYWYSKKKGLLIPERRDFDPLIEVPTLASGFFIYDVEECDFRLRLMGTGLARMFGRDVTGRLLSSFWAASEFDAVSDALRACIREGRPVASEGSFHWEGRDFVEWQTVAAPVHIQRPPHVQVFGHTSLQASPPRRLS
jgi:hypothetical protein